MSELPSRWLTVDIGESTGYAVWDEDQLVCAGTAELWQFVHAVGMALVGDSIAHADLELLTRVADWELIIIEDWVLYEDKALALAWDKQDTVRGLGALQFIATALGRPYKLQPALIKTAAKAAGAEELFLRPLHDNRHANDAIMHGVYWLASQGKGVATST